MAYKVSRWERVFGDDMRHLRLVGRRVFAVLTGLIVIKKWRKSLRESFDNWVIESNRDKIDYFIEKYPNTASEFETIDKILQGASLVRYNDGEYSLMIGLHHPDYQRLDDKLVMRLKEILTAENDKVLVGITTLRSFDHLGRIWKKFIIRKGNRTLKLFNYSKKYYSGNISGILWAKGEQFEKNVALHKSIWEGRKVLFVVGKESRFFFHEELFDNVAEHEFLYAPARHAFAVYEDIIGSIRQYDKDWLILIALGPTATVLGYDLAQEGYQAIDIGQTPSVYNKSKYGERYPEGHHLRIKKDRERQAIFK